MNRLLCFAALVDLVLFSSLAGQTVVVDDNIEFVPDSFGIANYLRVSGN